MAGARQVEGAVLATTPAALEPAPVALAPTPVARRPGRSRSRLAPTAPQFNPSALVMEVALCGCDPFSCVESGQYDQRAVKEVSSHAEVIWQAGHASCSGCKAR
jgi:hypothetical protein